MCRPDCSSETLVILAKTHVDPAELLVNKFLALLDRGEGERRERRFEDESRSDRWLRGDRAKGRRVVDPPQVDLPLVVLARRHVPLLRLVAQVLVGLRSVGSPSLVLDVVLEYVLQEPMAAEPAAERLDRRAGRAANIGMGFGKEVRVRLREETVHDRSHVVIN